MPRDYVEEAAEILLQVPTGPGQVTRRIANGAAAELIAKDRAGAIQILLRALDRPPTFRKMAVYALGQIGESSTFPRLKAQYSVEAAPGVKDALAAVMTAIVEAPAPVRSELDRRQIIDDVYNGRRAPSW
jgi:hypothetical protein